jgi:ribosomal protein L37AE/L43A
MTVHHCPHCRQPELFETGVFWRCASCGFAVTETALSRDEQRISAQRIGSRTLTTGLLMVDKA